MKLYLNDASPYARLIRVLLIETGLDRETGTVLTDPWNAPRDLLAVNPASKVPALVLEDGTPLAESGCIADYLIDRAGRTDLSPRSHRAPARRWQVLGLGRAAIDCAFGAVIQQRFAPDAPLAARWRDALPRIAMRLDGHYAEEAALGDQADLTVAVAFEYVDFRLPDLAWHDAAPALAGAVGALGERVSLKETRPR
jgi:glutathione S-transferase